MEKISLGLSATLTGRYTIQGVQSFNGIKLWVKEKNGEGGIWVKKYSKKIPLELIYYDNESNPKITSSNIKNLIKKNKVDILLGPYSSSLTLTAAKISHDYNKILWNYGGSSDEIFQQGFNNLVSSITPSSCYYERVIDFLIYSGLDQHKIAVVFAKNSGFSTQVALGAINYARRNKLNVDKFTYISGEHNFNEIINEIKKSSIRTILGVGRFEDDIAFARELIESGSDTYTVFLAASSIEEFNKILGKKSEGFLSTSQWEKKVNYENDFGPSSKHFSDQYKKKYGTNPDYTASQAYNIGIILEKLIKKTGTKEDFTLKSQALEESFTTFYGDFNLDTMGNQIGHKMLVTQWQKGKKEIIFPKEHSTSSFKSQKTRGS